jgi:hypothetical protein
MRIIASDPIRLVKRLTLLTVVFVGSTAGVAAWQDAPQVPSSADSVARILASEVELSRNAAVLRLELEDGESLTFALRDGDVIIAGDEVGSYDRSDALDQSWRALLIQVMDTPNDELAPVLASWEPLTDGESGVRLDVALEGAVSATRAPLAPATAAAMQAADSLVEDAGPVEVRRLQSRIEELEGMVDELESRPGRRVDVDRGPDWTRPLRYVASGFSAILATLALYAILVGLGFAVVFFGRSYLEGVADTVRHFTLRSWAVGFAATFLTVPVFILGTIALAISIVGIPILIAWLPLFPVAVGVAALFGYLAVGHAAGEALAERRLHGVDWYSKGNSYYYVLTGVGVLLVVFIAAHVIQMAGPWLGFLHGLLIFLGVVISWAALTIGFGAVLLSRAGTRLVMGADVAPDADPKPSFEEEPRV